MELSDRWASLLVSPAPADIERVPEGAAPVTPAGGPEPRAVVGDAVASSGAVLLAAWDEPHRRYHDRRHLAAVLDALDVLDAVCEPRPGTPSWSARVAAWYHDAVYDPRRHDNEAESAIWAERDLLRLGYSRADAADVARLVVLTADHRTGVDDAGGALLCDADLAILGRDTSGYDAYVRAVRAEYAHVEDSAWRPGRSTVLRSLLDRTHLYATPTGRRLWEAAARANLTRELADLGAVPAPERADPAPPARTHRDT